MSAYNGASVVEIRIYDDPSNPDASPYRVALPMTVLEAVVDQSTGYSLVQLFAQQTGDLGDHVLNLDVHTTAEWKNNIAAAINDLITHANNTDIHVTAADKALWTQGAATADSAMAKATDNEGELNSLKGRMSQVEDSLFNGITSNPFTVSFDSLSGLLINRGIWNNTLRRVEC